ncbi:hypothetical protein A33M_0171 [Rhodovulum sp. PH10]|uniref:hypothetical protein n=1 Tax=Rhodovulum sp. PH10 TaxID=1187851 RepID=UPI00027C2093|nr:hypothetical protein [Rhodovulum sp. PH10]EJW10348.1 hypothetical protein A33M_0171 [Rhodovulum sp. PH10]
MDDTPEHDDRNPKHRNRDGQQGTHEPWKEPGQRSQQTQKQEKVGPTGSKPAGGNNN